MPSQALGPVERLESAGATKRTTPLSKFELMLASPGRLPSGPGWFYELKFDGYRVLAGTNAGRPFLRYRRGSGGLTAWPELEAALAALPYAEVVLDGELVVESEGRPAFHLIQKRFGLQGPRPIAEAMKRYPAKLLVFDLLALEGLDARSVPARERKAALRALLAGAPATLQFVEDSENGADLYRRSRELGGEGVVAKRAESRYQAGRGPAWVKVRLNPTLDLVVIGYSLPGERAPALHVGGYRDGRLAYVGIVRAGLPRGFVEKAHQLLKDTALPSPACAGVEADVAETWVEPRVAIEVGYAEFTPTGVLRHSEFVRLRPDKRPEECVLSEGMGAGIEGRPAHSRRSRWG